MKRLALWSCSIGLALLLCFPSGYARADKELDAAVEKAVDAGVAFLKLAQSKDGRRVYPSGELGLTPLAGLTLLECGVSDDDSSVKTAANFVRANSINATKTYDISLSIMFLDRLADTSDVPFIESLTV